MAQSVPENDLRAYFAPLVNVILNWRWLLPEWHVHIYISEGHPYVRQLRRLGAEVYEKDFDFTWWCEAMTGRFLAEDDPALEVWASREAESPPTLQDAIVLKHWSSCTQYLLHAVHIAPAHQTWNGGLFGARNGYISGKLSSSVEGSLKTYSDNMYRMTNR